MYQFTQNTPARFTFYCYLIIGMMLLGLLQPAVSQESNETEIRFLTFPRTLEALDLELRISENKTEPIKIYSHEVSPFLKVISPEIWIIGETIENEEGNEVFMEYGRAPSTDSPRQLLLLVRKGAENSDGFDIVALDESKDAFSRGKFLFVNACKVDIAGKVGETKFVLRPDQHKVIEPEPGENERHAHAMFYFRKDDEARPFFSSRWPLNARARSMIFFYHHPKNMRIRMHTVRNFQ